MLTVDTILRQIHGRISAIRAEKEKRKMKDAPVQEWCRVIHTQSKATVVSYEHFINLACLSIEAAMAFEQETNNNIQKLKVN